MRPLLLAVALLSAAACRHPPPGNTTPAHPSQSRTPAQPVVVRDTALEQRAGRLELKTLEQEAQIEELQDRLDDARREVVRRWPSCNRWRPAPRRHPGWRKPRSRS